MTRMMRVFALVWLSAVSVGLFATGGSAAGITFESVTGAWTAASPASALSGVGTDSLRWGRPATASGQSGYDFDAASPFSAQDGDSFSLGRFTNLNNPVYGPSLTSARLSINYAFRIDDDAGNLIQRSFDVDLGHLETRNSARVCADGGQLGTGVNANGCADRVTLGLFDAIIDTFTVGQFVYTLTLNGFDTGGTFWTEEGMSNVSNLMGNLAVVLDETSGGGGVSPVPLPAAGWLMLAALAALRLGVRRG